MKTRIIYIFFFIIFIGCKNDNLHDKNKRIVFTNININPRLNDVVDAFVEKLPNKSIHGQIFIDRTRRDVVFITINSFVDTTTVLANYPPLFQIQCGSSIFDVYTGSESLLTNQMYRIKIHSKKNVLSDTLLSWGLIDSANRISFFDEQNRWPFVPFEYYLKESDNFEN
jgi:hypothetical protein